MKDILVDDATDPFVEIKIDNFKYDDEDKAILDFLKGNRCRYDPESKKWIISKAYFNDLLEKAKNNQNINVGIKLYKPIIYDTEIKSLYPKKFTPYPYQLDGIKFLLYNKLAILGDELGLGKTIQALIALKYFYKRNNNLKVLIVVPLSLIESNWKPQFKQVFGKPIDEFPNFQLVNYEKFRTSERDVLLSQNYDVAIFDEASRLRNPTQFRSGIKKANTNTVWLLSGELVEKDPIDIYTILNTFYDYFNYVDFDRTFVIRKILRFGEKRVEKPIGFRNLEKLKEQISPIYLRRLKKDIPGLKQVEIESQTRIVALLKEQIERLKEIQQDVLIKTKEYSSDASSYILSMFQTTRLVMDDAKYDKPDEPIKSSKYEELKNLLNELGNEKVIVFTSYKMILEKLYDNLAKDGYKAIKIDSEMSGIARSDLLKEFKESSDASVLLTSDIMSSGQNINEAYAVIHYDLPLMASTITQRIGRINRLDQTRNSVLSIIISTDSNFDRTVEKILNKKLVYGAVVKGEIPSLSFGTEEMEELLKNVL